MNNKIKTGTTCIGISFENGVILAADNRMTSYKIEADNFTKLFDLSKNVVSTIAGVASDAQLFMRYLKGEIRSLELKSEREVKIKEAAMILNAIQYQLLRSQGAQVACILGGFDVTGAHLFDLSPDGVINKIDDYTTDGSGSIFVQGVLDTQYRKDLTEKEAIELLDTCFKTSFKNDSSSGGGYIARIVNKDGIREIARKRIESKFIEI